MFFSHSCCLVFLCVCLLSLAKCWSLYLKNYTTSLRPGMKHFPSERICACSSHASDNTTSSEPRYITTWLDIQDSDVLKIDYNFLVWLIHFLNLRVKSFGDPTDYEEELLWDIPLCRHLHFGISCLHPGILVKQSSNLMKLANTTQTKAASIFIYLWSKNSVIFT